MSTDAPRRLEVLVCHDLGQAPGRPVPDLDALLAALERYSPGAVDAVTTLQEQTHGKAQGVTHPVHYVTFDTGQLRNTEAQGVGYRAGFVSSVSSVAETQQQGLF